MEIFFFAVAFAACLVGSICGMGGGVIIKPVLDAFGLYSVAQINFLSGCTVLCMSGWSVGKAVRKNDSQIDRRISSWLALGAVIGGILGKSAFARMSLQFAEPNTAGAAQAALLLVATGCTFWKTKKHVTMREKRLTELWEICVIGLALGFLGSFLGIGGGPFNVAVLTGCFAMEIKTAAQNSLYIILFSQASGIIQLAAAGAIPAVSPFLLLGMAVSGIVGSETGRRINRRLSETKVNCLFQAVMILIMGISVYNMLGFLR